MPKILASKSVASIILSGIVFIALSGGGIMKLSLFLQGDEYVTLVEMILRFDLDKGTLNKTIPIGKVQLPFHLERQEFMMASRQRELIVFCTIGLLALITVALCTSTGVTTHAFLSGFDGIAYMTFLKWPVILAMVTLYFDLCLNAVVAFYSMCVTFIVLHLWSKKIW